MVTARSHAVPNMLWTSSLYVSWLGYAFKVDWLPLIGTIFKMCSYKTNVWVCMYVSVFLRITATTAHEK